MGKMIIMVRKNKPRQHGMEKYILLRESLLV